MTAYQRLFEAVTRDPRSQQNLDFGTPRPGHPEGTVRAHIADLEVNLNAFRSKLSNPETDYWRLRVIIHVHDTFKAEARRGARIADPHSHASIARAFLSSFCDDADLLATVQNHDVPFSLWRQFNATGEVPRERLDELLADIRDWDLLLAFLIIDGCVAGKGPGPLHWFFECVRGQVQSRFTEADFLPLPAPG